MKRGIKIIYKNMSKDWFDPVVSEEFTSKGEKEGK